MQLKTLKRITMATEMTGFKETEIMVEMTGAVMVGATAAAAEIAILDPSSAATKCKMYV